MDCNQPFNDLPNLPLAVDVENTAILKKTIMANRKLAELKGIVHSIPNQAILIDSILLQEARLSSEIENIVTTNDELYKAAADEKLATDPQSKEVLCYRQALWYGCQQLKTRPLATNLFIELVAIIKNKNIGIRRVPGTRIGNSTGEVIYTPPEGEAIIREKLANLEQYIHADDGIDPLIKLAILHYQFEAIHPFTDGNGRTGRIINMLFLVEKRLLETPILFLSNYILQTRTNYYAGLRNVTERGAWADWILYILEGIEATATETQARVQRILALMKEAKRLIQANAPNIYSKDLVDILFKHPYCKIKFLEDAKIAKRQTASLYLQALEKMGLLRRLTIGREQYYINDNLLKALAK